MEYRHVHEYTIVSWGGQWISCSNTCNATSRVKLPDQKIQRWLFAKTERENLQRTYDCLGIDEGLGLQWYRTYALSVSLLTPAETSEYSESLSEVLNRLPYWSPGLLIYVHSTASIACICGADLAFSPSISSWNHCDFLMLKDIQCLSKELWPYNRRAAYH